ncbi:DUF2971 domain-containing protein [Cognataquiflexum rubidum]|uniref:DUF2971 domain-containing protein n=1 Tax=Cognataquiflexum rubidum TaxID=2922273 RepID=UPI001F13835E|nr:DUF2971 domain-containing protein [Cognataquiflexum rubidum]MCH6232574.1 DUF2971 domain-containing protein [Cognataquiflexum rubidum]
MKENKNWQRKFITDVFNSSFAKEKHFSRIILNNLSLLEKKNQYLPKYLFKYYSPTSDNILDIQNQKLWLSHPTSFNDPFDSNIGYDIERYEKDRLLKFIENSGCVKENFQNGFSLEDKDLIQRSYSGENILWRSRQKSFYDIKWELLQLKSEEFREKVDKYLRHQVDKNNFKIEKLKNVNIRVSCFSQQEKYEEFYNQILMWSHYANNHKGFCVEYDLEPLKRTTQFTRSESDFYKDKEKYIEERTSAIVKAGLFPIEYSANRVNIPVSKLNKLDLDEKGCLIYNCKIEDLIYKTMIVKSTKWKYEKEWRLILDEKISNYFNNKIPFPYAKTIYLGCRASNDLINTMMKVGKRINAEVLLMKTDGKKFTLDSSTNRNYEYENEKRRWKNPYFY